MNETPKMYSPEPQDSSVEQFQIKEGVDFVFEQHPELAKIGSKEQYSKYLETVFPESKVREILYHGTISENKIEKFDNNYQYNRKGVTYLGDLEQAQGYKDADRGTLYAAIVDLQNPYIQKPLPEDVWATDQLEKEHLSSFRELGYDGIVGDGIFGDRERVIFEPEQIRILGSKKDIEDFKEFVK